MHSINPLSSNGPFYLNSLHAAFVAVYLLFFFKINNFLKKFFQEYYQSVKLFGSRSGQTF